MRHLTWLAFGGAVAAGVFGGCTERDVSRLDVALASAPEPALDVGRLELALTAPGSSGALYRLREAQFEVFSIGPGFNPGAFLSTEEDPLATTLEVSLDAGQYVITLFPGWFLEKVQGGEVTRVQARLLSPESRELSITANEETAVSYRFETNGEVVEFNQGRLIVSIDVEERDGPAPDPVFTLGPPLDIVGGVIAPDSNPFGIHASAFIATSPLGVELALAEDTGQLCVSGRVDPVLDGDFASRWGGLFGFQFVSEELVGDAGGPLLIAQPWDLAGGRVAGFAFTVSGPGIPPLRLQALPGGADPNVDNFCTQLAPIPGEPLQVPFAALDRNCWENIDSPMPEDSLANVAWLVPADTVSSHVFDVCVSDVRPLLR